MESMEANKMRKFKFRAWDRKRKKFVYSDKYSCLTMFFRILERRNTFYEDLQEWTGLKDKDGKDIYEGDIVIIEGSVKIHAYAKVGNPLCQVIFNEAEFFLKGIRNKVEYENLSEHTLNSRIEVIGNIFENPSLLKNTRQ